MKIGVITFPGSNCDDDLIYIFEKTLGYAVMRLWHKDSPDLSEFDFISLPGGFSYGDYLRCGAMASISPIMQRVKEYAGRGGFVLGVCNGFQILCEAGLLPGALARNDQAFRCKDVSLKVETSESPWTAQAKGGEIWSFPIDHGEGRYIVDEEGLRELQKNNQILLTYLDNPNGSVANIAGVTNEKKNVFGLMPHPERATDLRSKDGMKLWKSLEASIKGRG